jgi:2-methylisocitrate lyase-like PEP mutase family enzyme
MTRKLNIDRCLIAPWERKNNFVHNQIEKAKLFRALHQREAAFILPNPWDVGTARLLAGLGFEALATTSAGFAAARGMRDYGLKREEVMSHIVDLAASTSLPVSADLENGFAHDPKTVGETIGLAAAAGAVGGSIEDSTGNSDVPIYPLEFAVERIHAAAEQAHSLPFPFTLTARCENYLVGRADLADTIRRLQAYREAGADVLYAPGLAAKADIAALVNSVDRPVNFLAGLAGSDYTREELAALGVKRISVGSGLARVAFTAFLRAATAMRDDGAFHFTENSISLRELAAKFVAEDF